MTQVLTSTITSKGQITIPSRLRRHLGVSVRDQVHFVIKSNEEVRLIVPKYSTIASLAGTAGKLTKPLSFKEMRKMAYQDRFK